MLRIALLFCVFNFVLSWVVSFSVKSCFSQMLKYKTFETRANAFPSTARSKINFTPEEKSGWKFYSLTISLEHHIFNFPKIRTNLISTWCASRSLANWFILYVTISISIFNFMIYSNSMCRYFVKVNIRPFSTSKKAEIFGVSRLFYASQEISIFSVQEVEW